MYKKRHEVRDVLYGMIEFDNTEKLLIDSFPVQRLRSILQLALCSHVYPGATHKRFEHSLGVMDVAGRMFDAVFRDPAFLKPAVMDALGDALVPETLGYWRKVVRIAGLLHDVGHLPFSHAAEKELLPEGWNHERITASIISESEISEILNQANPPIRAQDVIDICWDEAKRTEVESTGWALSPFKSVLNQLITGNTFGADRIDYLLRDSWHVGVPYGRVDPIRLISGLRLVHSESRSDELELGLDIGAMHAAEGLLLSRYFMYTQVYFHKTRRIYDIHLKEFLKAYLENGVFPTDWRELLRLSDNELMTALSNAESDPLGGKLSKLASRVIDREHFRTVYVLNSVHRRRYPDILGELFARACAQFGEANLRFDQYGPKGEINEFAVVIDEDSVESSMEVSSVIAKIPLVDIGFIYSARHLKDDVKKMIAQEMEKIFSKVGDARRQGVK